MQNCPQAGKWAISVWSGDDGTETGQALTTCGAGAVDVAYYLDPDTQQWLRWFAGRPEVSNLLTLDDMQGVLALGAAVPGTPTPSPSPTPTPTALTVHFIDVGQGDATLIEADGSVILVDGGDASASTEVQEYLQAEGIEDIDLLVATHPHADHIGGLIDVLALYDVDEIWTNGQTHTSQTYQDFAAAVAAEGATVREVARTHSGQVGALHIDVLHPATPLSGDLNEDSIVLQVACGEVDLLLTGDATTDSEASMQAAGVLNDVDVLKVGHHGSNTSTSDAFLTAVTPEDAVITVGAGNTYGHPHQETIDRLAAHGVMVYRTDEDGTVTLTSDCNTYSITTSGAPVTPTATPVPSPTPPIPSTWTGTTTASPVSHCREMPGLPGNRGLATLADAIT